MLFAPYTSGLIGTCVPAFTVITPVPELGDEYVAVAMLFHVPPTSSAAITVMVPGGRTKGAPYTTAVGEVSGLVPSIV
jgi:hypothetical protein